MSRLLDTHELSEGIVVEPEFARHETFHPRYGWLKKGFDAASADPEIFLRPDATTVLGVGKNMVRAIRYWCRSYKVLVESPSPSNSRIRISEPTFFGERVLGSAGWDPYVEDPATLWILHWYLLRTPCLAPSWFAVFNRFQGSDFTNETLAHQLRLFCDSNPEWGDVAGSSLVKDARCLLRMYASITSGRDLVEDTIDSPFTDLDLIRPVVGSHGHFVMNRGEKATLPDDIVAYACADFAVTRESGARLMTVSRLAHAPGSPGRAFQLGEEELAEILVRFCQESELLITTQAAGTRQLVLSERASDDPNSLLERFYMRSGSDKMVV